MYPRLPEPEPDSDGFAVLGFIIRTGVTVTCTETQLAQALAAATVCGRRRADEHPAVIERIRIAQDSIASTLRAYQRFREASTAQPEPAREPDQKPDSGSRVPRVPHPIAPSSPAVADPF